MERTQELGKFTEELRAALVPGQRVRAYRGALCEPWDAAVQTGCVLGVRATLGQNFVGSRKAKGSGELERDR